MKLCFDENIFVLSSKTIVKDENENDLYWGIYDFSYKHRRRIFKGEDEICYNQLLIETNDKKVIVCDKEDKELFNLTNESYFSNGYTLIGDIYNWDFKVVDKDNNVVIEAQEKYSVETKLSSDLCSMIMLAFARA